MSELPPPWSGLARHAPQLQADFVELLRGGAERALAELPALLRARVLAVDAWQGDWLRADSPSWPSSLRNLPGAPVALSWQGNLSLLGAEAVAVVGTRRCTATGRRLARELSAAVAGAGAVVVSGMAAGIDTEAHLAAGGRTIAVLGQGLAAGMAGWQERIRERILAAGGLVLSEYAPVQNADVYTFPRRNRIIAGLAFATVVVEAGHRSGAKITAHNAADYGRRVLAVPGPPDCASFAGCLDLIEEGAEVYRGVRSLLVGAAG
jgi:DNA processing protein